MPQISTLDYSNLLTTSNPHADLHDRSSSSLVTDRLVTNLMKEALLSWIDGVIILTAQGQVLNSNQSAQEMCDRLLACESEASAQSFRPRNRSASVLPTCLRRICKPMLEDGPDPNQLPVVVESELQLEKNLWIRVRVRWFDLNTRDDGEEEPYLLIMLEDRYQAVHNAAIAEVDRYHLTPRQAEVWLLHRMGYARQAIADELYISIDTVKKHLKESRMKQRMVMFQEEGDRENLR